MGDLSSLAEALGGTPAVALVALVALAAVVVLWWRATDHAKECAATQARMEEKLDRVLERLGEGSDTFDDHEQRLRALEAKRRR